MYYRSITVIGLACVIAHANADVNDVNSMLTESGLVKVQDITPDVQLDLRYATTNNFTGRQIYDKAECYLRKPVADALACVQQELKKHDLGIKIFDAYRPLSAQWKLWNIFVIEWKKDPTGWVADPRKGGLHTRGTAVDLTLVDLKTGQELEMPTEFDSFEKEATRAHIYSSHSGLSDCAVANCRLLEDIMLKNGFTGNPYEWWHYDFHAWQDYDVLDQDL